MGDLSTLALLFGGMLILLIFLGRLGNKSPENSTTIYSTPESNNLYQRMKVLEQKVDHLYQELGLTPPTPPSPDKDADITEFVIKGQKINAIKLYRERYGGGLKEAKDIIDQLERDLRL